MVVPVPTPATGQKQGDWIGPYKLLQQIGEGGMGTVWMAEQNEPIRRMVALKIIKPGMDSDQILARFEAERQALALMDHPNIAKVLDAGSTPEGRPYFVMELVKGIPLIRFCDDQRLSIRERLDLFVPVCQAIQHAHQKGIIHRDIKPSNVLVALYDGRPVPKVIDFGIAKATGLRLTERTLFTEFGAVIGTPEYMSPEQAELNQLDIDTRSDIYSLGVLLYELLTGSTPLTRESLHAAAFYEVLRRIREEEPPRPSTRLSQNSDRLPTISAQRKLEPAHLSKLLRGDLDWIVMKALEKDRNRRYETANGLATDILRHLSNETVVARPPSAAYRLRKLVRRNKVAVAAAAAVTLALIIGLGLSTWLFIRERQSRRSEMIQRQRAETNELAARQAQAQANRLVQIETLSHADELFRGDKVQSGLAYLAQALRRDPSNTVVVDRLVSAISLRGFSLPVTVPLRHDDHVLAATFSPNGTILATVCADSTFRLWEVTSGRVLLGPIKHERPITSMAFNPDGRYVLTTSYDGSVQMWDTQLKNLKSTLTRTSPVFRAYFTSNPQQIGVISLRESFIHHMNLQGANASRGFEPLDGKVYLSEESSDGKWLAAALAIDKQTGADRFSIDIWDTTSGRKISPADRSKKQFLHDAHIHAATVSNDGGLLASISGERTVRIWNIQDGALLTHLQGHKEQVWTVKFSPDAKQVVTASEDGTARLWNSRTGKQLGGPLRHAKAVHSAEFSPDGLRVLTVSADNCARVWDVLSEMQIGEPLRHEGEIHSARFSPNGRLVVTASADKTAEVWDFAGDRIPCAALHTGKLQTHRKGATRVYPPGADKNLFEKLRGLVISQSLNPIIPEGRPELAGIHTESAPEFARSKQFESILMPWLGKPLSERQLLDLMQAIIDFAQKANFPFIEVVVPEQEIAGGVIQMAIIEGRFGSVSAGNWIGTEEDIGLAEQSWQRPRNEPPGNIIERGISDYGGLVNRPWPLMMRRSFDINPEGEVIVSAEDTEVTRWDLRESRPIGTSLKHQAEVLSVQFSPDGRRIITASNDKTASVWAAETGERLLTLRHNGPVYSARFSPRGNRIVTCSFDGTAKLWDAKSGEALGAPLQHGAGWIYTAEFNGDGSRLLTSSSDGTAQLWDVASGRAILPPFRHEGPVWLAQFSRDGERIITASADGTAHIWSSSGALSCSLKHQRPVYYAEFSPDGKYAVTASADGTARVWDASTGNPASGPLTHQASVWTARFDQSGQRVLTSSADNTSAIWNFRSGVLLSEPLKHPSGVSSAQYSPDGRRVITISEDQTVRLWDLPSLPVPAPPWLPRLAEALADKRFDVLDRLESVPATELQDLRRELLGNERNHEDPYHRWVKWFLVDRGLKSSTERY
jgi:WD40 repeat protein/serine/threonine protein kinase